MSRKVLVVFVAWALILVAIAAVVYVREVSGYPSSSPSTTSTGTVQRDYAGYLQSGGLNRSYIVHLPLAYDRSQSWPLVLVFHGGGGNGSGMNAITGFNQLADEDGFIVVYPVGYLSHWADGRGTTAPDKMGVNDVSFVSSLIDKLEGALSIDSSRIYATGISNGGFMVSTLACQLSTRFAAVAVVAATMPTSVAGGCSPSKPVSFVVFHGTEDPCVPTNGGMVTCGEGGSIISVNATIAKWLAIDGCSTFPTELNLPSIVQDGTRVTEESYGSCSGGTAVVFYDIIGGGHTWPGGEQYAPVSVIGRTTHNVNATLAMWAFFQSHNTGP